MYPNKQTNTKSTRYNKPELKLVKGQAYKGEHAETEGFRMTEREKLLTAASQLGAAFFHEGKGTSYLPDPVKCDVDVMEAFNQGYAIAKINWCGHSQYTVGGN